MVIIHNDSLHKNLKKKFMEPMDKIGENPVKSRV
jgi:hypothetical protein